MNATSALPTPDLDTGMIPANQALSFLIHKLRQRKLAMLTGAGASASAGLPLWWQLGEALKVELRKVGSDTRDIAQLAGMFVAEKQREFGTAEAGYHELINLLENLFDTLDSRRSENEYGSHYPLLAKLPVLDFFTTNWDEILERCLRRDAHKSVRKIDETIAARFLAQATPDECHVVHLHGVLRGGPQHLIATDNDYYSFEKRARQVFERLKRQVQGGFSLLGIGYAFEDLDVCEYLQKAVVESEGTGAAVLALMPLLSKERAYHLWKRRGIQAINLGVSADNSEVIDRAVARFLGELVAAYEENRVPDYRPPFVPVIAVVAEPCEIDRFITDVSQRVGLEGLANPLGWFKNWPKEGLPEPLPPPTHPLLDRVYVERQIEETLLERLRLGEMAGITGLLGMGGIGKTFMAMKLAERLRGEGWNVAWVGLLRQGSEEAVEALAGAFGLYFIDGIKTEHHLAALTALFAALRAGKNKILVVLDNAERFPKLSLLLAPLMGTPVLITTRIPESPDLIHYERLNTLTKEESLELCRRYLDDHDAGCFQRLGEQSRDDLIALCEMLGGHPLGIRLVLAGYLRTPRFLRNGTRPFQSFLLALRRKGLCALPDTCEPDSGRAGESIHASIFTLFEWLFRELPDIDPLSGRPAQLLLPLVAALGAGETDQPTLEQGIKALCVLVDKAFAKLPEDKQAEVQPWITSLKTLQEPEMLAQALGVLDDAALIEPVEGSKRLRIHPLIREFAFEERERSRPINQDGILAGDGPCQQTLLKVVLNTAKQTADPGMTMLDLLPRVKREHYMAEDICKEVLSLGFDLYFRAGRLDQLRDIYSGALELARQKSLPVYEGKLACALGELLDRMAEAQGLELLREGLELLFATGDADAWKYATWPLAYLSKIKNASVPHQNLRQALEDYRSVTHDVTKLGGETATVMVGSHVKEHASKHISWQQTGLSTNSKFLSNCLLDLAEWLDFLELGDAQSSDVARAQQLYFLAIDKANKNGADDDVVSPDKRTSTAAAIIQAMCRFTPMTKQEIDRRFSELMSQARLAGLRGLEIRQRWLESLWRLAVVEGKWSEAAQLAEQWRAVEAESTPHSVELSTQKPDLLNLLCRLASGGLSTIEALAGEQSLSFLEKGIRAKARDDLLGWLLLARGLLDAQPERANPYAAVRVLRQARRAFLCMGKMPPEAELFYRRARELLDSPTPRFEAICDRLTLEEETPPDLMPWVLDRALPLPRRVRSRRDGRCLRLVKGGLQGSPNNKEIWLYPFYVDETLLEVEDYRRFCRETGRTEPLSAGGSQFLSLSEAEAYANWAGRRIPTAPEWWAAKCQLGLGHTSEQWLDWDTAKENMFRRVEAAVNGKPLAPILAPISAPRSEEDLNEYRLAYDYYTTGLWLKANEAISRQFEELIVNRIRSNAVGFSGEPLLQFAVGLVASISLSIAEKLRLFSSIPSLSLFQLDELTRIFLEERKKFSELDEKHFPQLVVLTKPSIAAFLFVVLRLDGAIPNYVQKQGESNGAIETQNMEEATRLEKIAILKVAATDAEFVQWWSAIQANEPDSSTGACLWADPIHNQPVVDFARYAFQASGEAKWDASEYLCAFPDTILDGTPIPTPLIQQQRLPVMGCPFRGVIPIFSCDDLNNLEPLEAS